MNYENNAEDRNLYVRSKKNDGGERIATLIDPLVHLKFLALVLEVASHIEGKRVPKEKGMVHSYRFLPDVESGMIFDRRYGCGSVSFESVQNTLLSTGINPETVNEILSILRLTSNGGNCGLPIGGNASRIIAEVVLNGTDQVLIENNLDFVRFVDDFVFFPEREMEINVLSLVKDIFSSFGFGINYQKLKITGASEVLTESDFFRDLPLYDGEVQSPDIGLVVKNYYRQIRNIERDKCLNVGLLKVNKSKPENPEIGGACTIVSSLFKMVSRHSLISWLSSSYYLILVYLH